MPIFPGKIAPSLNLPSVNGGNFVLENAKPDVFTVVVFYRGLHCPLCKMHIQEIEENLEKIHQAGLKIVAVSMDDQDLAATFAKEVAANMGKESLDVPILYNLTEEQASRDWGLFLSNKRPGTNEPELYSEPGLFVIRPDNTVFFVQRQSAPFTRPSMEQLVFGLTYAAENKYPTRGTVVTEAVAAKVVAERASLENPGAPTTQ